MNPIFRRKRNRYLYALALFVFVTGLLLVFADNSGQPVGPGSLPGLEKDDLNQLTNQPLPTIPIGSTSQPIPVFPVGSLSLPVSPIGSLSLPITPVGSLSLPIPICTVSSTNP